LALDRPFIVAECDIEVILTGLDRALDQKSTLGRS
jgi:hypothetical protein